MFGRENTLLTAADLEDLLSIHPFRTSGSLWAETVADAVSRLTSLAEGYAVIGTIAMGIHTRPRFTEQIRVLLSCAPSSAWLEALRNSGYKEYERNIWTLHGLKLSISVSSSSASLSVIQHARLHRLFGRDIRVAEAKDLLWVYLESGELPESMSEAVELISNCPQVVEELRSELVKQHDLVSRLDRWAERADLARLSNYSDSVIARRTV